MRAFFSISLLVLAAFASASLHSAGAGSRSVQLVYESDTRGYYLPCG